MQQDQEPVAAAGGNRQKTILLIEDQLLLSQIIKRAIESHTPHRVVHLSDGTQIEHAIAEHKPDLLLLDYELPGQNGIELYDIVHAMQGMEHLPTIMLSADLPYQEMTQRTIIGIRKPWQPQELFQALKTALQ